jgi:myo-inositol-1(or 4)-monophosphatase
LPNRLEQLFFHSKKSDDCAREKIKLLRAAIALRSFLVFFHKNMSSPNLHPMLNVATRAARAAGAIINRAALDVESLRISQKQVNDFVTEVDQASEAVIIETLLTAYPDHGILAEESGSTHGKAGADNVWIIDPLDGTTNFIHGFPVYCVSIALAVRGKIEQAVVYDPTRNDLFTATKGRGAYVNDRRLRVSKRIRLEDSLISTGFPFRPGDNMQTYLAMMADVMPRTAGLRRPGAAALDLAYVAAGFTEGFFETGLSPWDVAAGSLLVQEAGGLVGNLSGEADFLDQKECLAANPRIYAQMVGVLGKYSKFASVGEKAAVRQTLQARKDTVRPARSGIKRSVDAVTTPADSPATRADTDTPPF